MQVILAALTLQEATFVSELEEVSNTPIITIGSATISPLLLFPQVASIFHLNDDVAVQMQCSAAIVGHFRWQKVTVIYEQSDCFYSDSRLTTQLSEALKSFNCGVEYDIASPSISSLQNPEAVIEEEMNKLRSKSSWIFVLMQSSSEFAKILFGKAVKLGMMEKGYAWILYDDIVSLLDSVEPSVIQNMKGITGFKTNYMGHGKSFLKFKCRFRRKFSFTYAEEEEYPNPSTYAFWAYDAAWAIAKAMQNSEGRMNASELINRTASSDFEALSGRISLKKGKVIAKNDLSDHQCHWKKLQRNSIMVTRSWFLKLLRRSEGERD